MFTFFATHRNIFAFKLKRIVVSYILNFQWNACCWVKLKLHYKESCYYTQFALQRKWTRVHDSRKVLTDDMLKENKFIRSLSDSAKIVNRRIEVKMPWKEGGPPPRSNYNIAYKRMLSSDTTLTKGVLWWNSNRSSVQVEENIVTEVPNETIDNSKPEWYLPVQAMFTPERSTKIRFRCFSKRS